MGGVEPKQPRRDNLLRPRWPVEFVVEPVQVARYGIVALETAAVGYKAVKVRLFIDTFLLVESKMPCTSLPYVLNYENVKRFMSKVT